jgi:hypothetical protein
MATSAIASSTSTALFPKRGYLLVRRVSLGARSEVLPSPPAFFHLLVREVVRACILRFHFRQYPRRILLALRRPSQNAIENFLHLLFRHDLRIS